MERTQSPLSSHATPITLVGMGAAFVVVIVVIGSQANMPPAWDGGAGPFGSSHELKKFSSYEDMVDFLSDSRAYFDRLYNYQANYGVIERSFGPSAFTDSIFGGATTEKLMSPQLASDASILEQSAAPYSYSRTNVQVEGVDEADFLKNDARYAYILSGDRLTIIDAVPPESAKVVSRTSLDIDQAQGTLEMFLNGDTIITFYQDYGRQGIVSSDVVDGAYPPSVYEPRTHMLVIDISDRTDPEVVGNYDVTGQYSASRMIGDRIFLLTVGSVDYRQPVKPSATDSLSSKVIAEPDVYYFDYPQQNYAFNTVTMLDLDKIEGLAGGSPVLESPLISKTFMVGDGAMVYASDKNIYLAYQEYLGPVPLRQETTDFLGASQVATQKTVIHKISIQAGSLFEYAGKGTVPGLLHNQFSMNEDGNRFSVATTSESSNGRSFFIGNNVYTLDERMEIVGKLEGIAPGESIYAARFMGDRLYLVTFRQTDPFFVVDLSSDQPKVLGELKLPGFSNYLHPYDVNHVIGIGREGSEVGNPGVKVALFDVSDVRNPIALDTYTIGSTQTDSEVLRDHKALLFDLDRDILSIPVTSYDGYYRSDLEGQDPLSREIGPWNGFYVFGLGDGEEITIKGTIQHNDNNNSGFDMAGRSRSFFIGDTLYTVTPGMMKMHDLDDLRIEKNAIPLGGN